MKKIYLALIALLFSIASMAQVGPITGTPLSICIADMTTLSCTPPGGTWSSSSPTIASVGATTGIVMGNSAGVATITYSAGAMGFATVDVTVNPQPATIGCPTSGCNVCLGGMITVTDATPGGLWSSANPAIADIGSATGDVTGMSLGTTLITYMMPTGCFVTSPMTVIPNPSAITATSNPICVGETSTLNATPPIGTPPGTWISSNPTIGSVSAGGIVTGVSGGVVTITYMVPTGCYTTIDITVNPTPVLSCGSAGMCMVCTGDSITISASVPGGVWTSGTPGVGTVGSMSGVVTGVSGGVTTITYTLPTGCSATAVITVNPAPTMFCVTGGCTFCAGGPGCSIGLSGSQLGVMYQLNGPTGPIGGPVAGTGSPLSFGLQIIPGTYSVTAYDPFTGCRNTTTCNTTIIVNPVPVISGIGSTGARVCIGNTLSLTATPAGGTWSSANTTIATVGSTGIVTGINSGITTISYTLAGCTATVVLTVDPIPAIFGTLTVCVGNTTPLSATPSGGTWTSSPTSIATITGTGVVTGGSPGTATVTYTSPAGCINTVIVTVNPLPTISGTTTICVSSTGTLTGSPTGGTWSSSNPSIATVNPSTGTVTGIAAGTAVITYTLPTGCFKAVSVNIITAPAPISCASSGTSICQVCVLGTMTMTNATPGGVWSSSNPSVATIGSSSGIVTGISAGTTIITYSLGGGCFTTATLTVNPLPSITGPNTVCAGFTITLSGSPSGGTWSTSGPVATVGVTTGVVSGLIAGVANITYTLPTGCATSYNVTVNPMPCLSLGVEQVVKPQVEIFPNPAHSEVTVNISQGAFNSLTITNNVGQVVMQQQLTGTETTVDIKALPAAIYYVTLRGSNGIIVRRFVKE